MPSNMASPAPIDTHPARASSLQRGDQVWIGYPTRSPLAGYLDEPPAPVGSGDYALVITTFAEEDCSTETTLVCDDYPGLRRFYPRAKFTDADSDYTACLLLGDVVTAAGVIEVLSGAERVSLGPETPALVETLQFLATPRTTDDAAAFLQARQAGDATPPKWSDLNQHLATWSVGRRGSAAHETEALALQQFRYVGARLDAPIHQDQGGWFVAPHPERPHDLYPIQEWLRSYLSDPDCSKLSLYDFTHQSAQVTGTPLEEVTRDVLYSLNWVAGRGVTLVALPRPAGLRGFMRKVVGRG